MYSFATVREDTRTRLKRLKSLGAFIAFLFILKPVSQIIGAVSNIDFAISASGNPRMVAVWNFLNTPLGNMAFLGVGLLWLGYLIVRPANEALVTPPTPVADPDSKDNRFFNFHVLINKDTYVLAEISYYYNGCVGSKDVVILGSAVKADGSSLGGSYTDLPIVGHKALARISFNYDSVESVALEFCMAFQVEEFHCQRFPFVKKWKQQQPTVS